MKGKENSRLSTFLLRGEGCWILLALFCLLGSLFSLKKAQLFSRSKQPFVMLFDSQSSFTMCGLKTNTLKILSTLVLVYHCIDKSIMHRYFNIRDLKNTPATIINSKIMFQDEGTTSRHICFFLQIKIYLARW